jgi:hypothetical protein
MVLEGRVVALKSLDWKDRMLDLAMKSQANCDGCCPLELCLVVWVFALKEKSGKDCRLGTRKQKIATSLTMNKDPTIRFSGARHT